MKRNFIVFAGIAVVAAGLLVSCASTKGSTMPEVSAEVKKPVLLDHKNLKWGKEMPEWVAMEPQELEAKDQYKDMYLFKFESPRSKSLEGAELWTRDFSVPSELARTVKMRIESKAAAAAVGDKDKVEGYIEDIVKTITDTKLSGFKKVSDYWIQQRYFDDKGKPAGDDYTYIVLYSIDRNTLDRLIDDAISGADEVKPKTEEEERARELVKNALHEGI